MQESIGSGAGQGITLSTERLTLRWPELSDFADMLALWSDADVVRHIGGRPFTTEEVWQRLLRYCGHWTLLGYGFWNVRETATGAFVGEVGFADWRRSGLPELDGRPEGGWVLMPGMHGKGYAGEALGAALAWLDRTIDATSSTCIIQPDNAPSLRLAERHGYRLVREAPHRDGTICVLIRERPLHSDGTVS